MRLSLTARPPGVTSVAMRTAFFSAAESIARLDRFQVDLLEPAVSVSDRGVRYAGEESRHFAACATLGEIFEVLSAGIHQSDNGRSQVFGKDQRRQHRQRGHDVQPHIAAAQADDDLAGENGEDGDGSRGPDRTGPMPASGKQRREPNGKARRRQGKDDWSEKFSNIRNRPSCCRRSGQVRSIQHALMASEWTSDKGGTHGHPPG